MEGEEGQVGMGRGDGEMGRRGDAGTRRWGDGEMGRWGDATRGARYVHVVARGKCLGGLWLRWKCIISGEEMMQSVASVSAGLQSGGLGGWMADGPVAGRNGGEGLCSFQRAARGISAGGYCSMSFGKKQTYTVRFFCGLALGICLFTTGRRARRTTKRKDAETRGTRGWDAAGGMPFHEEDGWRTGSWGRGDGCMPFYHEETRRRRERRGEALAAHSGSRLKRPFARFAQVPKPPTHPDRQC